MQKGFTILDRLGGILADLSSFVGVDNGAKVEPACSSRDRISFVQRTHSYQASTWFAKPYWLSPIVCARYGWMNVDVDLLRCVGCQSVLVVRTPSSFDPAIYGACQERLEKQLKQAAHHPCCTWPSCPTPDAIVLAHVGGDRQANVKEDFIDKALHLYCIGEALPAVDYSDLDVTETDVTVLCDVVRNSEQFLQHEDLEANLKSAVLLALVGWEVKDTGQTSSHFTSLQCSLCKRQPGLWNYVNLTADNSSIGSCTPVIDLDTAATASSDVMSASSYSPHNISDGHAVSSDTSKQQTTTNNAIFSATVEDLVDSSTQNKSVDSAQFLNVFSESQKEELCICSEDKELQLQVVDADICAKDSSGEDSHNESDMTDTNQCSDYPSIYHASPSNAEMPIEIEKVFSTDPCDSEKFVYDDDEDDEVKVDTTGSKSASDVILSVRNDIVSFDVDNEPINLVISSKCLSADHLISDVVQEEFEITSATAVDESQEDSNGADASHMADSTCHDGIELNTEHTSIELEINYAQNITCINESCQNDEGDCSSANKSNADHAVYDIQDELQKGGNLENLPSVSDELLCTALESRETERDNKCTVQFEEYAESIEPVVIEYHSAEHSVTDMQESKLHSDGTSSADVEPVECEPPLDSDSVCSSHAAKIVQDMRQLVEELIDDVLESSTNIKKSLKRHATDIESCDLQPVLKRSSASAIRQIIFNPVSEHRVWCPYICDAVCCTAPSDVVCKPWLRLLQQLLPNAQNTVAKFRMGSMPDGIEHIRNLFCSWTSNA